MSKKNPTKYLEMLPDVLVKAFKEYITIDHEVHGDRYEDIDLSKIKTAQDVLDAIDETYYKGLEVMFLKFILTNRDNRHSYIRSNDGTF